MVANFRIIKRTYGSGAVAFFSEYLYDEKTQWYKNTCREMNQNITCFDTKEEAIKALDEYKKHIRDSEVVKEEEVWFEGCQENKEMLIKKFREVLSKVKSGDDYAISRSAIDKIEYVRIVHYVLQKEKSKFFLGDLSSDIELSEDEFNTLSNEVLDILYKSERFKARLEKKINVPESQNKIISFAYDLSIEKENKLIAILKDVIIESVGKYASQTPINDFNAKLNARMEVFKEFFTDSKVSLTQTTEKLIQAKENIQSPVSVTWAMENILGLKKEDISFMLKLLK